MTDVKKATTPGEVLLRLRGISKHFGAVTALSDIELDVHAGEVVAIVGDNGAGKSTLIKILAGVYQPNGGTIEYLGKQATLDTPAKALEIGIATVFQDLALCENLDEVGWYMRSVYIKEHLLKEQHNPSYLSSVEFKTAQLKLSNASTRVASILASWVIPTIKGTNPKAIKITAFRATFQQLIINSSKIGGSRLPTPHSKLTPKAKTISQSKR